MQILSGTAQLIRMVFNDELGSPNWAWKCLPQVGQLRGFLLFPCATDSPSFLGICCSLVNETEMGGMIFNSCVFGQVNAESLAENLKICFN